MPYIMLQDEVSQWATLDHNYTWIADERNGKPYFHGPYTTYDEAKAALARLEITTQQLSKQQLSLLISALYYYRRQFYKNTPTWKEINTIALILTKGDTELRQLDIDTALPGSHERDT